MDNQLYHKSILVDRSFWEAEVLNHIFYMWYREYSLLRRNFRELQTPRHAWFWDGFVHVDPTKEATAQEIRLANSTTTLAAECARDGRDYMTVLRQRAKEIKLMKELGIPINSVSAGSQNPQTEPDDGSEPREDT